MPNPIPDSGAVSLKEHIEALLDSCARRLDERMTEMDRRNEQRFNAQEKATSTALAGTERALTTALAAVEKGQAAAIEANKVLAAKAEEFADQKLQTHNAIKPWVQSLIDGQAERVAALERRVSRFEHREEGIGWTTKLIVGAIGLAATLVGIYLAFG